VEKEERMRGEGKERREGEERKGERNWMRRDPSHFFAVESIAFRCFFSHKIATRGPLKSRKCTRKRLADGLRRTRWGRLSSPPDPLATIWGLLLRGGYGKEEGDEEGKRGEGRGKGEKGSPPTFCSSLRPCCCTLNI